MTPSEFKFWFDGFTEAFSGCPTKAQWSRIKERVAEIDGTAVTERVYLDRYWPSYPIYPYYSRHGISGVSTYTTSAVGVNATSGSASLAQVPFNSLQAMGDLGRAEAKSFAA